MTAAGDRDWRLFGRIPEVFGGKTLTCGCVFVSLKESTGLRFRQSPLLSLVVFFSLASPRRSRPSGWPPLLSLPFTGEPGVYTAVLLACYLDKGAPAILCLSLCIPLSLYLFPCLYTRRCSHRAGLGAPVKLFFFFFFSLGALIRLHFVFRCLQMGMSRVASVQALYNILHRNEFESSGEANLDKSPVHSRTFLFSGTDVRDLSAGVDASPHLRLVSLHFFC